MAAVNTMSDAQLLDYSFNHVKYEIIMFFGCAFILSQTPKPNDGLNEVRYFALLESCVIHFRNLADFLHPKNTQQDDVISDFFFDSPIVDWKRKRPAESDELRNARDRASKEISHLTNKRRNDDDPDKPWDFLDLAGTIKPSLDVFVSNASAKKLHNEVRLAVESIQI